VKSVCGYQAGVANLNWSVGPLYKNWHLIFRANQKNEEKHAKFPKINKFLSEIGSQKLFSRPHVFLCLVLTRDYQQKSLY
jgi:hypothetical protein